MPEKKKLPFFELLRQGWRPYWTLAQYMKPYRSTFVIGLLCGVAAGMLNGVFPLVVKLVGEKIFPSGQDPNAYKLRHVGRARLRTGYRRRSLDQPAYSDSDGGARHFLLPQWILHGVGERRVFSRIFAPSSFSISSLSRWNFSIELSRAS